MNTPRSFALGRTSTNVDALAPGRERRAKPGHGEMILVIDDEKFIGALFRTILENHGYRALVASSGPEGVEMYRVHQIEVKVIITDMLMPGLQSAELMGALRQINPTVKVVLMSGLIGPDTEAKVAALGCAAFLQKPVRGDEISRAVESVLAGDSRG